MGGFPKTGVILFAFTSTCTEDFDAYSHSSASETYLTPGCVKKSKLHNDAVVWSI